MHGFVALHLRRLREHPGRASLSVGGIAVGIALMVAMLGLFGSLTSSADRVAELSGNATLEVSAPNDGGIPAALVKEVAAVDGVRVAAPLLRSQVGVNGRSTLLLGSDERARKLGPRAVLSRCVPNDLPQRPGVIAGPETPRGKRLRISSTFGTVSMEVLARIDCGEAKRINAGRFIMGPLELAQQVGGKVGRVDSIAIVSEKGQSLARLTEAVDKAVAGRAVVASPRLLATQARTNTEAFQQGSQIMVVLALVVGGFCVFNTVSMTALERRRELATLRAIGGSRRRLLIGFLLEMTLLGVVGSALGAVLGAALGARLIDSIPPVFIDQVGVEPSFEVPVTLVRAALVLGTLVTLGAAFMPARSAVRVAPVEAMRPEGPAETSAQRASNSVIVLIVGMTAFIGGTVVALGGSSKATLVGFGAITVGALTLTYALKGSIATAAASVAGLFGSSGRLAGASIERAPRRTWATVTAVTVAVGTVVAIGGVVANQVATFKQPFTPMARPDLWVGTSPTENIPVNLRFQADMLERLPAAVPWIGRVVGTQSAYTTVGKHRVLVQGFDRNSAAPMFARTARPAQRELFDGAHPAIVINTGFAFTYKLKRHDDFTMVTAVGPLTVRVADVVDVPSPSATGTLGMDRRLLEQSYGRVGVNFIEVYAKDGISRPQLKRQVEAALRQSPTPAFVATGDEQYAGVVRSLKQATAIFRAMQAAVIFATALALANALLISVIERRRELGIVRAVGTSRRQLRRMVVIESLAIGAVGTVIGVLLGLLQHRVGDDAIGSLVRSTIDYEFVAMPMLLAFAATTVTAVLAALLPAARAANVNVIEAIGYE
ncbi:MAG TPA: FtsX-like permease family protein [Acidimicrobiales bacterium]|nr:FtsX-like permease family protein [Acidimicrobiales bacterium]